MAITAVVLLGYYSVYFEKLDERETGEAEGFDAEAYAHAYLEDKLIPSLDQAVEITELLRLLRTEKEETFGQYSHALGIGNIRFFLVKGEGVISAVREDYMEILPEPGTDRVRLATEYIFGNAVRDAAGLISMHEFDNTMHLNEISAEINRIIRAEVLPPFKTRAREGDRVQFTGAIELNREHLDLNAIEIIPVTLKISDN